MRIQDFSQEEDAHPGIFLGGGCTSRIFLRGGGGGGGLDLWGGSLPVVLEGFPVISGVGGGAPPAPSP